MPTDVLTRRTLLRRAAAAAATGAAVPFLLARDVHADTTIVTFALDPTQDGACGGSSCASCSACRLHAANKLFRTAAAADAGRAHPGCNCAIVAGEPLSQATSTNVFAQSDMADRRYAQTVRLLNGEVEQREVPMAAGIVPAAVMAVGAAAIGWAAIRRRVCLDSGGPLDAE